ncbi:hypothetical protein GC197_09195 [bacterium]|nr:hypothetical protein [bacterium]
MNQHLLDPRIRRAFLAVMCLTIGTSSAFAADEEAKEIAAIQPVAVSSAYFGEEKIELGYRLSTTEAVQGKLFWQYSAGARTLARGEEPLDLVANQAESFKLPMELPPVREGVTFATQMTLTVVDGDGKEIAKNEQTIWLFPQDPFVQRKEWLQELNIQLFDPAGDTAKVFEKAGIPFDKVTNSNVLADIEEGILIVGAGTSLRKNRALADALGKLPQRGVRVLCLSLVDGELIWPDRETYPQLENVSFSSKQIVRQYDKRLFPDFAQTADAPPATAGIKLESKRGQLKLIVEEAEDTWPWWRVKFQNQGTCIVCCLDLIEHWDRSPTPRFLLKHILEQFSSNSNVSQSEQ